ncbi:MAG: response regulator [Candidatus Magnetomorum sp.]|nr:response regulator [Candidatus Magnetomorum sp.]
MHYRFLIVHHATVIQKIIHKFLLKLYDSALVDICLPEDQALKHIAEEKYHIVFSGLEMAGLNGFDIHNQLRLSKLNSNTPFIIMTASDSSRQKDRFKHRGIPFFLTIPCTFRQFQKITQVVLHPDLPDEHMRFLIPKAQADIQVGNRLYKANIVNIGMDSMDCELLCPEEMASMIRDCAVNLRFPEQYGHVHIDDIHASLLRFSTKARLTDTMPQRLRTTWKFTFTGLDNQSELARVINQAPRFSLDMYEDLDNIYEINDKLTLSNEAMQNDLYKLQQTNERLLKKIEELETIISENRQTETFQFKDVSLSALINETAKTANDPAKLKIFQRVIDDNVQLRKFIHQSTAS